MKLPKFEYSAVTLLITDNKTLSAFVDQLSIINIKAMVICDIFDRTVNPF